MKSKTWIVSKYWHSNKDRNWIFSTREGDDTFKLLTHADTPIIRHVKVKGERNLFDGDLAYWSSRLGKHPEMPIEKSTLLINNYFIDIATMLKLPMMVV